jgi:hypothetical protein
MASNRTQSLSFAELLSLATTMRTTLAAAPATYNLSNSQITALTGAVTAYDNSLGEVAHQAATLEAARQDRDLKREQLLAQITMLAALIYANPNLTPAQIAATGLQVHDKTPTSVAPQEPTQLTATPFANGTVLLDWKRNGNPRTATFVIETKGESGDWRPIKMVGRSRATLSGFPPGTPAWFRVYATKGGQDSVASFDVSIYHEQNTELELAA